MNLSPYYICKALHLFSMVIWFSGTIALFRVFTLHGENQGNADATDMLKSIAAWCYKVLVNPGMIATWIFGIAMIGLNPGIMKTGGWLHAKLLLVLILSGFMGAVLGKARKRFEQDEIYLSPAKCKMFSQIVLAMLFAVICLAVLRPF